MQSDAKERKGAGNESGQRWTRGPKSRQRKMQPGSRLRLPERRARRDVGETVNTGSGAEQGTGAGRGRPAAEDTRRNPERSDQQDSAPPEGLWGRSEAPGQWEDEAERQSPLHQWKGE